MDELEKLFGEHRDNANCKCGQDCFCWDVQKYLESKDAAEHHAHLTPESLASSQAVINASAVSQSDGDTRPAQAQVA